MEDLIKAVEDFRESGERLVLAAKLCKDDPIRRDMVKHIHDKFIKMEMRFMGLQIMVQKGTIERDMVIAEMKSLTELNKELYKEIELKLITISN